MNNMDETILTETQKQILQQNAREIRAQLDHMPPGEEKATLEAAFKMRMRCYNACIALEYPALIHEFQMVQEAGINLYDFAFLKSLQIKKPKTLLDY